MARGILDGRSRSGAAVITCTEDVLDELGGIGARPLESAADTTGDREETPLGRAEQAVIDAVEASSAELSTTVVDFSVFQLPVIAANDEELAAHERLLAELDKASGGKTVWRHAMA